MRPTDSFQRECHPARVLAWLGVVAACLSLGSLSAATLTASFNTPTLEVGRMALLTVTCEGGTPALPPELPALENAQTYRSGQSTRWQSINGVATVAISYNFQVMPLKTGDLVIPAVAAVVNGQRITSKPLTIKVLTPDQAQAADAEVLEKLAWIKIQVPKNEAYLGEVIPAQIQVYATAAENLQLHQFKAEGYTLGRATHTSQGRVVENNVPYHVITFHMPIAARKVGRLPVGPAECTLNVQVPQDSRNRNDPFTQLDVFGRPQMRPMRISSQIENINILPLPTNNVPLNFSGAVGSFSMKVTAGPTNLMAGDPITFRVEIQAKGTLDDLSLPEQSGWREFKTYPATSQILQKDPLGLSGTKLFEQIVVPAHAEITELPPFQFSYFDPEQRRYHTLTHPAIPLRITPNTTPPSQPSFAGGSPAPQPEAEKPRADIAHIEPRLGTLATSAGTVIQRPWFYLLQGLPIAAWLTALYWRRRQQALAKDPRLLRRRQVEQLVQTGLKELRLLAERGDGEAFYETTLRLLKEQLGERLDLPGVSITEQVIDDRLRLRGVPTETLNRLHELFQTCNHARYAGQQSVADLNHSLAELEALLAILKQVRAK